jgi:hypothetical protein
VGASRVRNIHLEVQGIRDLALVDSTDAVWVVLHAPWWDIASWFWWWFCPRDRQARVVLKLRNGDTVRTKAIRVATRHTKLGGRIPQS